MKPILSKRIRAMCILVFLLSGFLEVGAQNCLNVLANGSFNTTSTAGNNQFCNGFVPNWSASHGSPQAGGSGSFAFMWADDRDGEGIFTNISLTNGKTYILSINVRMGTGTTVPVDNLFIKLVNNFTFSPNCSNGQKIPSPSTTQQLINITNINNVGWSTVNVCFTVNGNFDKLWIFPRNNFSTVNWVEMDDIQIVEFTADAGYDECGPVTLGPSCSMPGSTYSWSPTTGLSNPNIRNPYASNPSTSQITYTLTVTGPNGGCTATDQVTVKQTPSVSMLPISDVCENGWANFLIGSPSGGTFYGPGVSANVFDPSVAGPGNHFIDYYYTASNGCASAVSDLVTVFAKPSVSLSSFSSPMCVDAAPITLSGGSPSGGTYSGPGVSSGQFNPATAGVGTHTITYTYTDGNGCSNYASKTIQVVAKPTVTLSAFSNICINASILTLTGGSPAGGTYSGTGVSSGQFNPVIAGVGTYTITYSYTDGNGCANTASQNITVLNKPTVTMGSLSPVCISVSPFALSGGSPSGGTYSGTGVSGGQFNPSTAGAGTHTITYTYTGSNGCSNTASTTIQVYALPTVTLGTFSGMCYNASPLTLTGGSPTGGTYSGNGVSSGQFNPTSAGVGTSYIYYSYTDANGCVNSANTPIVVNPLPTTNFTFVEKCQNDPDQTQFTNTSSISSGTITSYSWNFGDMGTSTSTSPQHVYNPTGAYSTPYYVTYSVVLTATSNNGCTGTNTKTVKVYQIPAAPTVLNAPYSACNNSPLVLEVQNDAGVTYKWFDDYSSPTVLGTGTTFTTPAITSPVDYYVASYAANSAACTQNRVQVPINTVNTPPSAPTVNVASGSNADICPGGSTTVTYSHSGSSSYTFQWNMNSLPISGATGTTYNFTAPSNVTVQTSVRFSVTVTDVNTGCQTTSADFYVRIKPAQVDAANHSIDVCPHLSQVLTGPDPAQTYTWYFDDPSPSIGPVAVCTGCSYNYTATANGDYYYVATNATGCSATSGITTINIYNDPTLMYPGYPGQATIAPGASVMLTGPSGSFPTVYTYKWYKNGVLITSCGGCNTYNANTPGTYQLVIDGSCGLQYTQTVQVVSSCNTPGYNSTYANSYTFSSNTTLSSTPGYTFGGTILVNNGVTLTISGTQVEMKPCTEIIVAAGGTLNITNSNLHGCDQWKGITVNASGGTRGAVSISNSTLSDAVIGIYSPAGGQVTATNSTFTNNNAHVALLGYTSAHNSTFTGNYFNAVSSSGVNCSGISISSFSKSSIKKMIYLDGVKNITIESNTFTGNSGLSSTLDKSGIHMKGCDHVDVRSNTFAGELRYGVDVENSSYINIGSAPTFINTFDGSITTGVNASGSNHMDVSWNTFGNMAGTNLINGAMFTDVETLTAERNQFLKPVNGLQYYISYNASATSNIMRNLFQSCTYGSAVAPSIHPVNTTPGANSATHIINLQYFCNKFYGNKIGIVGAGNISNQGSSGNESANDFSNIDWDVLWAIGSTPATFYHYSGTGVNNINATTGGLPYVINNAYQTTSNITVNSTTASSCRGSWKMAPTTAVNEVLEDRPAIKVYPNPVREQLKVELLANGGEPCELSLYDISGRLVLQKEVVAGTGSNIIQIDATLLSEGVYLLKVNFNEEVTNFKIVVTQKQ